MKQLLRISYDLYDIGLTDQFLENAFLAFDKSTVAKEYKEEIEKLKKS